MTFLFLSLLTATATPWKENPESAVRLLTEASALAPGDTTIAAGVELKVAPHWHVYWRNSGDAGFAPSLIVPARSDVKTATIAWPRPHRYALKGGLVAFGYEDAVTYPATLTLRKAAEAGRTNDVRVTLDYLVCADECVPYRYDLALELPTKDAPAIDPVAQETLAKAHAEVPSPLWPEARVTMEIEDRTLVTVLDAGEAQLAPELFFTTNDAVDFGTPTRSVDGGRVTFRTPLRPKRADWKPEPLRIEATFTSLQHQGKTAHAEVSALASVKAHTSSTGAPSQSLPVVLLFALLGGFLLNLMPCVLPVLSLKLLGLLGHQEDARRGALWSAAGILASFALLALFVLSLRAAGAQAGWGVQFQEPTFVAFLAVVVTLFALNLFGVFEITLPQFLMRAGAASTDRSAISHFTAGLFATLLATPCSAPFLGTAVAFALAEPPPTVLAVFLAIGAGMSAPYLLLAARPSLVRVLPKPGMWMVRLKQALGFALLATAVWLVFVLMGQLSQVDTAVVQLLLVGVAAAAWAVGSFAGMTKRLAIVAMAVLSLGVLVHARRASTPAVAAELAWEPFDLRRFDALMTEGRPVFVDVTADWCFTCKVNEQVVLASPEVAQALKSRGAVLLKADWTKRDATIGSFLADHGKSGIPFYLFQPEQGAPRVLPELLNAQIVLDALRTSP